MTLTDTTARSQTDSISFEFDLPHSPAKVWRALTDPALLGEWLLPVVGFELDPTRAYDPRYWPRFPAFDRVHALFPIAFINCVACAQ